MDRAKFETELNKAKMWMSIDEDQDYWKGYQLGLRRAFHGENFGTGEEHQQYLAALEDDIRHQLGLGYRDGLRIGGNPTT